MESNNIFKNFGDNKAELIGLVEKANSFGWWNVENEEEKKKTGKTIVEQIKANIESDTLTIGVIGQMKCGKSTFLNAFVFGKEVLPAATTPMTASLTVITYGSNEKLVAEFYTVDEWEEQKHISELNIAEFQGDPVQQSKIKAAKELVEQSKNLGTSIQTLLGKTQEDSLSNLENYVGAEGKFVSITKSVRIEYPADYLKGVEIVDTPGFNDPIVSREERTKDFLKRADAVLMMLYANQPFSKEDNEILFDNVRKCGVGKVIVAVNKYDIPYQKEGDTVENMTNYVKEQLELAVKQSKDDTIKKALGTEIDPICISAQMELLSLLPMSYIRGNKDLTFHLDRYYTDFEISSQPQLHEYSRFSLIIKKIKKMLTDDKANILFRKPIARVLQTGETIKTSISNKLINEEETLKACSMPDDELVEKKDSLDRVIRRANRKIENLGESIDEELRSICRRGVRDLEDMLDAAVKKMNRRIDDWGVFQNSSKDKLERDLKSYQEQLVERDVKYKLDEIIDETKSKLSRVSREFINDMSEMIADRLEDTDTDEIIANMKKAFDFGDSTHAGNQVNFVQDELMSKGLANGLVVFGGGLLGLGLKAGIDMLRHEGKQQKYRELVDQFRHSFDASSIIEVISGNKNAVIEKAQKVALDDCLVPLQDKLQEIIDDKENREKMKKTAENNVEQLKKELQTINSQIAEISNFNIVKQYGVN